MLSLAACSGARLYEVMDEPKYAAERTDIPPYFGHYYWPALPNGIVVYETRSNIANNNLTKGRFFLDGRDTLYMPDRTWLHVQFDNGVSGYIYIPQGDKIGDSVKDHDDMYDPDAYPLFLNKLSPKEAAARRKLPGIRLDSKMDDVLTSAWGAPLRREQHKIWDGGHRFSDMIEFWYYPGGAFLRFDNQRVDVVQR